MKTVLRFIVLLIGASVVISGCSAISSMLYGGAKDSAVAVQEPSGDSATTVEDVQEPAEAVLRFTFYESHADW